MTPVSIRSTFHWSQIAYSSKCQCTEILRVARSSVQSPRPILTIFPLYILLSLPIQHCIITFFFFNQKFPCVPSLQPRLAVTLFTCQGWQPADITGWWLRGDLTPGHPAHESWFYLTNRVALGKSLYVSVPLFPHLCNGVNNNSDLTGLLCGLHWVDILKGLEGSGTQYVLYYMTAPLWHMTSSHSAPWEQFNKPRGSGPGSVSHSGLGSLHVWPEWAPTISYLRLKSSQSALPLKLGYNQNQQDYICDLFLILFSKPGWSLA